MSAIDINNDGEISRYYYFSNKTNYLLIIVFVFREEFVSNAINSKFIYEMLCEQ